MVSGVILAGGKSKRMGVNKALLQLGNNTLVGHVIHRMQSITEELLLITNSPDEYAHLGLTIYDDIIPNAGALGGIHSGLSYATHNTVICVGCDNPFLKPTLLSYLVSVMGEYDAVIPFTYRKPFSGNTELQITSQTLCSVYSKRCKPIIEQMLNENELRVHALKERVNVLSLGPDIWKLYDCEGHSFFNINTPEDFEKAQVIYNGLYESV